MTSWNNALNQRNPISKLYNFKKNNGTTELLAVSGTQLHKVSSGSLTPITGTLTSGSAKVITYKDRSIADAVLLADGGKLKVYNGTNVSEVTPHVVTTQEQTNPGLNDMNNLTKFRTMALKKDRIFAAAHPTVKNRVSFSYYDFTIGYAVYDYFPATYFFDVATEDNDEITELRVFRNYLIIFCKNSIWALIGDGATLADYELIKLNVPKGCISPGSVCEVGNNLFFLSDDHVYSLFATDQEYVSAQIVSEKILPLLKSVTLPDRQAGQSIFFENKYYLSFPDGTTVIYDITLESWTKYSNVKATSFIVLNNELYFSANDGSIYHFNENLFSDNGDPIEFVMKTKLIHFDMPVHTKKFRRSWVITKQWSNFNTMYDMDITLDQAQILEFDGLQGESAGGSSGIWDLAVWDSATWDFSETMQDVIKLGKKARDIQFKVMNSYNNEPLTVYGFVMEYTVKKKPKG